MQVLTHHEANPWTGLTPVGAALRKAKAWLTYRAWASPAARIRWSGACGHFEGRVPIPSDQTVNFAASGSCCGLRQEDRVRAGGLS